MRRRYSLIENSNDYPLTCYPLLVKLPNTESRILPLFKKSFR